VFTAAGRVGLAAIVAAFIIYLLWKWVQRQRFIRQLKMDRMTVQELRDLLTSGEPTTIVDVRSPLSQSVTGRIPGAITVDVTNMKLDLLEVEPTNEVVVYCACPNEESAATAAKHLRQAGFKKIRPLLGGIDAWVRAGHPIERPS